MHDALQGIARIPASRYVSENSCAQRFCSLFRDCNTSHLKVETWFIADLGTREFVPTSGSQFHIRHHHSAKQGCIYIYIYLYDQILRLLVIMHDLLIYFVKNLDWLKWWEYVYLLKVGKFSSRTSCLLAFGTSVLLVNDYVTM